MSTKKIISSFKKFIHKSLIIMTAIAVIFSSVDPILLLPVAQAATFSASTSGLPNEFPGSPVPASSSLMPVVKLTIAPAASATLTSIQADFSGMGFAVTDLADLNVDGSISGVALFNDAGGGNAGSFGMGDAPIPVNSPTWSGTSVVLTPTSMNTLPVGSNIYYLLIKTSAGISNNDQIRVTIPANGIITSEGNGPVSAFSANELRADTSAFEIISANKTGNDNFKVRFSRPAKKAGAGFVALDSTDFVFIDKGATGGHIISNVAHTVATDFATITLNGLDDGDFIDGGNGISTIAAGSNKISDMAANVMGTGAVNLSNPPMISTPMIPSTYVGANHFVTPLVTFGATGGSGGYVFTPATTGVAPSDQALLAELGLVLNPDGTLKSVTTVADKTGSFNFNVKVTDSATAYSTKFFNINVATTSGGGVPGISSVTPGGGAKGTTNLTVILTGANTNFSASGGTISSVQFLLNNVPDSNITVGTRSSTGPANLSFPIDILSGAAEGNRDIKVATGSQVVTMPNAFGVFASGGSGLNLMFPGVNATNIQMPPGFNFNESSNGTINSYRITVNTNSTFSGTTLWDYAFPRTGGHCSGGSCNVSYGAGQFFMLAQPTPLNPNTTYYWQVKTYTENPSSAITGATAVESTGIQGFTTVASITDTMPPNVMHRPIFRATQNADLNVFARVLDNSANENTTPALTTKILYCKVASCTPATEVSGTSIGNGYYRYIVPLADVGSTGAIVRYYLQASDGPNSSQFKMPNGDPFQLTTDAAGALTIGGAVKDGSNANITGAVVFADGTGFNATTSGGGASNFSLTGLPAGNYDLVAVKNAYADRRIDGIPAGASSINFNLPSGSGGGFGGDLSNPRVKFTGPMDGMNGIPGGDTNFKIFMAFDKTMSQSSVTASGNMLVKKVTDFSTAIPTTVDVAGSWTYYSTVPNVPGVPPEANLAVFTLSVPFGDNQTIIVAATSNVTDTAGNPIQGNQPDGSYGFMFTTNTSFTGSFGSGTFGQGAFMPPHVIGTNPPPGSMDIPRNTKSVITFSDPMADDSVGTYVLKDYVKLFTVSGTTETEVTSGAIDTVALDATKLNATVNLKTTFNTYNSVGSFAAGTKYRLKVLGGAKAANGMTIAPPGSGSSPMFVSDFTTKNTGSASTDFNTDPPRVVGSYPNTSDTGVPVNLGAVNIGFDKDLDASTISTSTAYLSIGSTAVTGTVEYRALERQIFIIPKNALTANTMYTVNVSTVVKGLNGVALATAVARNFTTGGADTTVPSISFMNVDDYAMAVTFSEPMNAAKATDTINWATSVINQATYNLIEYGDAGFNAVAVDQGTTIPLTSATFKYDTGTSTVIIEGLDLKSAIGKEVYLEMDINGGPVGNANISRDLSGNQMTSPGNVSRTRIQDSQITKGALGPMAQSGSAFDMGGGFTPTNFSSATFGFAPPIEVRPFNMMAGKTTIFGVRLPISRQITAGGTVVLTFPTGFNIAGAKQDVNSPMRTDLNGPGTGTPTFKCNSAGAPAGASCFGGATATGDSSDAGDSSTRGASSNDGVVINSSARTVTVYLSADTNKTGSDEHDFLTIDVAGIVNSTVPKDFNTAGYTVDIKTKNGSTVLESLTSMPFFIQEGGSNSLTGTITATGASDVSATANVYLDSPMTGPMETTVTFSGGGGSTATYTFANLPTGEYFVFTDPVVTLGGTDFIGKTMPERIYVSANPTTYNFSLINDAGTGTAVTVTITGTAGTALDVFAGSPVGFKAKQVTIGGGGSVSTTINLANGQWFLGVGPQMPKGPQGGPPPAPDYLPPKPKDLAVTNPNCTVDGVTNAGCSTAITFALTSASKDIKGLVQDASGKVIANAEVFAYSPQGGFGTHTQSDSTGAFTLRVNDGSFVVGSFVPGMPPSQEVSVVVNSDVTKGGDATNYLFIKGATAGVPPATAAATFILKVAKPDYTISGKVTDGTNVANGASVYAYRTDGPGNANANTDSSGNYTLYVSNGTWKVGAFLPQYGNLSEVTVVVNGASASNQNFSPTATGTFYTVSGRVYKDITTGGGYNGSDEAIQGAFVRINGNNTSNEAVTGSDGTYSIKVPGGNGYVLRAVAPGIGDLPQISSFNVGADVPNKDFAINPPRTITFSVAPSAVPQMFVDVFSATGMGGHTELKNITTGIVSLPEGSYQIKINVPGSTIGYSDVAGTGSTTSDYNGTTGVLTVNGNETLTITLPTLRTVSGTVKDASAEVVPNAWVEIGNPAAGVHFGTQAGTDGTFSLQVANSASDYFLNAMKPGYFREPSSLTVNAGVLDAALTNLVITLSSASTTISGRITTSAGGAANAFVRAERQGGGFSGTQADANGYYTLPVNAGLWKVFGVAEGYAETGYAGNPVDASSTSPANINITLSGTVSLRAPKSKPMTPKVGGTLEDTTTGVKLTVPGNALGSSTTAGNLQVKETNNVRETSSARPVGGKAQEIKATVEGTAVTTLQNPVTIEMSYTKAELAATASADDLSINTKTESDKLQMAYWDDSNSNWITLPSTLTYLDSNGAMITTPAADLSDVTSVTVKANTTHFSLYAPIVATNPNAPSTPSGLAATAASTSQVSLSWTQTSGATGYDIYRSTSLAGTYSRVGSEPTVSSGSTVSYSDVSGLSSGATYYYKITALNTSGESTSSSAVPVTTLTSSGGSSYSSYSTPTVVADTTPPTNTSISIAAGAANTTTASVTLTLAATGASQMMISNVSDFASAAWETYTTTKTWTLTSGNGTKTVYAKFRDSALNASTAVSDTITLGSSTTTTTTTITTTTTAPTTTTTTATTPTAPVIIPALPSVPTTTDIQTVLIKVAEQVAYIQANLTATNALSLLADVAQRLSQLQTAIGSVASGVANALSKPLQVGSENADVTTLQTFLKFQGSEIYPEGLITGYFGPKTEAAVGRFQVKHGLVADSSDPAYGYVGPATRAKINSLLGL